MESTRFDGDNESSILSDILMVKMEIQMVHMIILKLILMATRTSQQLVVDYDEDF